MIELVIFDCDGVLVDSERLSQIVMVDMLAEYGVTLSSDAVAAHFVGASDRRSLEILGDLLGRAPPSSFLEDYTRRTQHAYSSQLTAIPGIEDVLSGLTLPYCVASNSSRSRIDFSLQHTDLLHWFENRIYSAEQVAAPKPAPDLFLLAASVYGVEPSRCLVIEDSSTGVIAARAAGMRVYGFTAMTPAVRLSEAGAHRLFSTMRDLPMLIDDNLGVIA